MPILPLITALLLYRLCRRSMGPMNACVHASVIWGVLVLLLTELLSLGRMVTLPGVAAGWGLITLMLAGTLWRTRGRSLVFERVAVLPIWAAVPTLVTLIVTLVIALVAAPNSTDALTYHLARVAHWMQHGSVDPYATSVTRQIYMPPWPSYVMLHLQVLSEGSDRFAALVQWFAFVGCLVLGGGLARQLDAGRRGVGLTVVLIAALPTAVIEASSTQTDLVVAFWCAAFVWITLGRNPRALADTLLAGSALGLAIASKGTAYVVCAPFVVWWLLRGFRSSSVRKATVHAATLAAMVLLVNLPLYARNVAVFDHPLGPSAARAALGNASHGFGPLASNVVRNATVHLRTPNGSWNERLARAVERLHSWIGLDVQDPRTTFPGDVFSVPRLSTYEGRMGNLLHFLVFGVAALLLWVRPIARLPRQYGLAVLAGAVLFCWIFRWQHWHGRLHTPFFVLAAPLVAITLQPLGRGWRAGALAILLWTASLPWLIANNMRPLVALPETRLSFASQSIFRRPREQQYLDDATAAVYWRVLRDLARAGCTDLGLVGREDTRVYPLVPFARAQELDLRLHYLFVANETRQPQTRPRVCALFVAEQQEVGWLPGFPYDSFELLWRDGRFALWRVPGST